MKKTITDHPDFPKDRSKAFQGAWRRGYLAGYGGLPKSENPYDEHDICRGGPTFARVFHRYWDDGWEAGDKDRLAKEVMTSGDCGR